MADHKRPYLQWLVKLSLSLLAMASHIVIAVSVGYAAILGQHWAYFFAFLPIFWALYWILKRILTI